MPGVNASGDIFSLNGDLRYEGIVNGRVGGGGALSVSLEAETCHGFSLDASARALVEVNGALSLLLAVRGSAFATATAGVNAKIQFKPDLFERFGVIIDAAAYAEASAGFNLGVGLDFALLAKWGKDNLTGAVLEIFLAFLQELVVEAGVWGRASAAAMAQAHVDITLSLADDEHAGFIIEAGAAAGLGLGTGWDFFGAASFTDVRRFYRTASRIIGREAGTHARAVLPRDLVFAADAVEFLLPLALNTAYELGQTAALQSLVPTDQLVGKLLGSTAISLRDFTFARVLDIARGAIEDVVYECAEQAMAQALGDDTMARFDTALDRLVTFVRERQDRDVELEDIPELASRLVALVEIALPDQLHQHREAIALLWTAAACAKALSEFVPLVSGHISVVGSTDEPGGSTLETLPTAPETVLAAYSEALGRDLTTIEYRDAIDYLMAVGLEPLAEMHAPAATALLRDLADRLDLTAGELIELGLRFALDADDAPMEMYEHLRAFLTDWLDDTLRDEVLPRLRDAAGASERDYVGEVAEPSLAALSDFLLVKLDALVAGINAGDEGPFQDKLSAGCSAVVYRIFARNVIFFEHLLFEHLLDSFEGAFQGVATAVARDPAHSLVRSLRTLVPLQMPNLPPLAEAEIAAIQQLAADIALIGIDAFGPRVWSPERRRRYARLKRDALLGYEGDNPFPDAGAAENFVRGLILCDTVPNEDAIGALAVFVGEQLAREAELIVPRGILALEAFGLRVTQAIVDEFDRQARAFLQSLAALVAAALRELNRWQRAVRDAIDAAVAAARAVAVALERVADQLGTSRQRRAVMDALHAQGAREAERFVRDHYPDPNGEDQAVALAVGAFHLAFLAATPLIDLALQAAGAVADEVGDIVAGAADGADALELLVEAVVDAALEGLTDGLATLGISLPSELSPQDVADAIADALPLELLSDLLGDLLTAQEAEVAARDAELTAQARRDSAQEEYDRQREQQRAATSIGPISIEIVSPMPLPARLRDMWRYGREVPVIVRLAGVTSSFFRARNLRVRVALNGKALHIEAADWRRRDDGRFEWQAVLRRDSHPLVQGLNVFEVSVTPGDRDMKRRTLAFLVDFAGPALGADIVVDADASNLDTPGDDHRHLLQEKIVLRSRSTTALALDGWRVLDLAARHTYVVGAFALAPNAPVTLVTGGSADADSREVLHWGQRAAVWNNTGDVVNVVDERGVLRAQYIYEPGA
jgi:hypothetical protein